MIAIANPNSVKKILVTFSGIILTIGSFGLSAWAHVKMPIAKLGKKDIVKLEVASTEAEIQRGLMYRTSMPEDQGMVFIFHPGREVNFWMYHTLIPLDMLFIKNGKIVKMFENVPPCKSEDPHGCPTYPPLPGGIAVTEVVEVNGGYAKRHELKEGDSVVFESP